MKTKLTYVVFGIALLVLLFTLMNFYVNSRVIETREIYASVNVTINRGGADLNTTALTFAKIARGGGGRRNIIIENNYNFPVTAFVSVDGDIAELINFNNKVEIEKGEAKKISFSVGADEDEELGFYDGIVRIEIMPA